MWDLTQVIVMEFPSSFFNGITVWRRIPQYGQRYSACSVESCSFFKPYIGIIHWKWSEIDVYSSFSQHIFNKEDLTVASNTHLKKGLGESGNKEKIKKEKKVWNLKRLLWSLAMAPTNIWAASLTNHNDLVVACLFGEVILKVFPPVHSINKTYFKNVFFFRLQ